MSTTSLCLPFFFSPSLFFFYKYLTQHNYRDSDILFLNWRRYMYTANAWFHYHNIYHLHFVILDRSHIEQTSDKKSLSQVTFHPVKKEKANRLLNTKFDSCLTLLSPCLLSIRHALHWWIFLIRISLKISWIRFKHRLNA